MNDAALASLSRRDARARAAGVAGGAGGVPRQRPARQRRAASRRSAAGSSTATRCRRTRWTTTSTSAITDPERRPADDRPVGRGAAVERDQLPGQVQSIDLFTWAFSLDLLGGADGALAPIGDAITSLYENVIGEAWMVAAILIAGIWGIWKALVQRRYTETAGALAVSVAVRADRAVLRLPARAHDRPGQPVDQHALARVPLRRQPRLARRPRRRPSARSPTTCSRRSSTSRGWCSSSAGSRTASTPTSLDDDGFPRPVGPHDPARDVCRDHLKPGTRRARRLRRRASCASAPGSDERKAEYDALREGRGTADRPRSSPATRSTRPTRPRSTSSRPAAPTSA